MNGIIIDEIVATKRCSKCREIKALELFRKHKLNKSGRQSWCRECDNEYNRERRKKPEYIAYEKGYRKTPRGKELQKQYSEDHANWLDNTSDGSVTDEAKSDLRRQQNNQCYYTHCRKILNDIPWHRDQATTEHLVSRKHGGLNIISNVVIACRSCNSAKGDAGLDAWLDRQR